MKTALENNTAFIKIEPKTFCRYRIVEILNSHEI